MRIVAGSHRGRRLEVPEGRDIRPTSDRARQAVFNILEHNDWGPEDGSAVAGARVLDAFCGTGALGLEALSRGAGHCTFLDLGRAALETVHRNVAALREEKRTAIVRADATKPPPARTECTLAFLDPPYGEGLAAPALAALAARGWLAPGAVAVVETGADEPFEPPEGFERLDDRTYGAARVVFLKYRRLG